MTTATTMRGFVPNPAERGTIGILWSCLTTLFLCAWTSLHLDLPSKRKKLVPDKIISAYDNGLLIKIWWMLIMLFAPELILAFAVNEWCEVYRAMRHINREGRLSGMDMWTMDDGFFLIMEGFTYNGKPVNVDDIGKLIQEKTIPPQPSRAQEICDKSKSDALGKTLTCTQALWLAIQCLARVIQHLPMSTLELGTIGYVFIAVAVNGLYWHKPKDVLMPLEMLSWESSRVSGDSENLASRVDTPSRDIGNERRAIVLVAKKAISRWLDGVTDHDTAEHIMMFTLAIVCVFYGGWHCLAWNFTFPSTLEKRLWHIGSILTGLPGIIFFTKFSPKVVREILCTCCLAGVLECVFLFFLFLSYIISRCFILVEMFIGLRRLPAGVFDTVQWMAFIPHV